MQSHTERFRRSKKMAETTRYPCPPYATYSAFINFLNKLRDTQVPGRIDPSVFGNASGSISYSVIAALKSLKLIAADGTPVPDFVALVRASDDDRKPLLNDAMKSAYPTLSGGGFSLANATASQFDEHIRLNYEAKGSTVDKVASFFIAAAQYAEIPISDLIKARKAASSSASSNKSKRQRSADSANGGGGMPNGQQTHTMSDKALEYKLVDLMKEDDVGTDERAAIWVLIQYLARRPKNTATDE